MKKVFITDFDKEKYKPKELFPLVRPFLNSETCKWKADRENYIKWNCPTLEIETTSSLEDADFVLVSEPLNHKRDKNKYEKIAELNSRCAERNILLHIFVSGDFGKKHPEFSNVIYYRMSGFRKQLNENNKGFVPLLNDHSKKFFNRASFVFNEKKEKPTIGFCGHATYSIAKMLYEKLKLIQINGQRSIAGDFNFEPLFSSAFERLKLLKIIGDSKEVNTNFIFREKYRAGAVSEQERFRTTKEYYDNIINSDYVFCLRGSGNFSIRLYETMMMGRIPVFVNTDCLLPFEDQIEWKKQVVWVEWKDREKIADIISEFHRNITKEEFVRRQKKNREIWLSHFTVGHYLENISKSSD